MNGNKMVDGKLCNCAVIFHNTKNRIIMNKKTIKLMNITIADIKCLHNFNETVWKMFHLFRFSRVMLRAKLSHKI